MAQRAVAPKRKARDNDGPVGKTPNWAERKPRERRQKNPDEGPQQVPNQSQYNNVTSINNMIEAATNHMMTDEATETFDTLAKTLLATSDQDKIRNEEGPGPVDNLNDGERFARDDKTTRQ